MRDQIRLVIIDGAAMELVTRYRVEAGRTCRPDSVLTRFIYPTVYNVHCPDELHSLTLFSIFHTHGLTG